MIAGTETPCSSFTATTKWGWAWLQLWRRPACLEGLRLMLRRDPCPMGGDASVHAMAFCLARLECRAVLPAGVYMQLGLSRTPSDTAGIACIPSSGVGPVQ